MKKTNEEKRNILGSIRIFMKRLFREKPMGAVCFVIICIYILVAIFADQIAPFGINDTDPINKLKPPSEIHFMGTDNVGRDLFSRVVYGARVSVGIGFLASVVAIIIGVLLGTTSGYFGGKFDLFLQRFVDAFLCIPQLILLMVVLSILGGGTTTMTIVLGVYSGLTMSRVIRSSTISVKENVYIKAAIATGCSNRRIIFEHIVPNIMPDILIVFATRIPAAILNEASLSYLGFGVQPPTPSWGGMLSSSAVIFMYQAPWMVIWPGLFLMILVFSVNMFADALRDLVDPKLRGNAGASDFRLPTQKLLKKLSKRFGFKFREELTNG